MRSVGGCTLLLAALLLGTALTASPAQGDDLDTFDMPIDMPAFGDPDISPGGPRMVMESRFPWIVHWRLVWEQHATHEWSRNKPMRAATYRIPSRVK
jgi:hypothetical protein